MKKLDTSINKTLNEKFTMGELKHYQWNKE